MEKLKDKKCFIFDMDGTIYLGDELIDGSLELFDNLNKEGKSYFFLTNNSSKTTEEYVKKLNRLGISTTKENVITSNTSTINFIKERYDLEKEVFFIVGTPSMEKEFEIANINFITKRNEFVQSAIVIVGFDTSLTYQKLQDATYYLQKNPVLIATNCDLVCPLPNNEVTPDCGSIVSLLEKSVDSKVIFCGKPEISILEPIFTKGFKNEEMLIIGDRLYTDIALGFKNSIDTALVLTGEANIDNISKSNIIPNYVINSVKELIM